MRICPRCKVENEDDATRCLGCQGRLRKRERASQEQSDSPFSEKANPINRPAVRAYYLAIWGLIPLLGLILGPLAAVLAQHGKRIGKGHPGFSAYGPARAAVLLGIFEGVTQWLGVGLMWWGS